MRGDQTLVVPFMSYLLTLQLVALAVVYWGGSKGVDAARRFAGGDPVPRMFSTDERFVFSHGVLYNVGPNNPDNRRCPLVDHRGMARAVAWKDR
jgi:hypothetical protein